MQECMYKKQRHDFAQMKQQLVEVWADLKLVVVDNVIDQRKRLQAMSDLKDNTLTHAVTCDVTHCLNRYTVTNDCCFSLIVVTVVSVPCYEHRFCTTFQFN